MATGVNYWSSYEPRYQVRQSVWGGEQESSSEEGGGGVTWDTHAMEVKGQLISAPDPLTCTDRKQRERMAELQDRRRSLQALLSTRLAELRRICLQEAELTGAVPSDFPLEAGEKPPCVRRRGGSSRQGNRKCRVEDDDLQRSKPKKTLFSSALRKHSDTDNNNTQTHTHHGKRTVHRGCHTDDTVRSESSSTTDSTEQDNDDGASQCRPPLDSAGSPVEVFYPTRTRRNSIMTRVEHQEVHKPLPLLPSHPPPLLLLPPPPPPRSQDSSSSSGPFDLGHGGLGGGVGGANVARRSNSSDGLLDRVEPPEDKVGVAGRAQPGTAWLNGAPGSRGTNAAGGYWSSDTSNGEGGGRGGGAGGRRDGRGGGGYSEVLLDYVWGKQQQLQRPPAPPSHQPTTSQHHLYNGYASSSSCPSSSKPPPPGAPPTYRAHHADQQRVKVTRTKSCGPFLPVPQGEHPVPAIQPDPHPHLLPPRAPQLPPHQDSQLEEATRSLHKALALEGLRDWYLRNTIGSSHQNQINGKVPAGGATPTTTVKLNGGVKGGQAGGGGALQRRRTTHGVLQQPAYQAEAGHHHAAPYHKQTLPHSATFHGHPLHDRSVDGSLYQDSFPSKKQEVALRDSSVDQPSPGTLV